MDMKKVGWLAGIIDGEGNFTIRIMFHKTKLFGNRARFQPQLVVCNTRRTIIDKIAKIYDELGIEYRIYARTCKIPNSKQQWHVIIYANALRQLLPLIEDILDKRDETDLIAKFLETNKMKGSANPYTNEQLQELEKLRQKLIALHGNNAKKLSKRLAIEHLLTPEQIEAHDKYMENNIKKMVTQRMENRRKKKENHR